MRGAYGLSLPDLSPADDLLRSQLPGAPVLRLEQVVDPVRAGRPPDRALVDDIGALHVLADGRGFVEMTRDDLTARFTTVELLPPDHLVHPYLAFPAAVANRWQGNDILHAGAFAVGDRAWGVLGTRDSGKSSLMAQVARLGVPVLTDDLVVVRDGIVQVGPGIVDLRREAAEHWDVGEVLGKVGRRERWRVQVEPARPLPLAGWLILEWGEPAVERVPPMARLPLLMTNVGLPLPPPNPLQFFELADHPVFRWGRPRDWSQMERSTRSLLDELARVAEGSGQ